MELDLRMQYMAYGLLALGVGRSIVEELGKQGKHEVILWTRRVSKRQTAMRRRWAHGSNVVIDCRFRILRSIRSPG